jgi:hypothetical protein
MRPATRTIELSPIDHSLYVTVQQEVELGVGALNRKNAEMALMLFGSALQKLDAHQPFHDQLLHNLLLSYKLMIEQKLESGNDAAANALLEESLKLEVKGVMANDTAFLHSFASVFDSLSRVFFKRGKFEPSVRCCRKAIEIYPASGFRVNLENALRASAKPAVLSDFASDLAPEQVGRHIFIACTPKSGSTFLKNVLVSLTGYRDAFMVYTPGQFEQDIYLPSLTGVASLDTVTQQHCRASDPNVQMMQAFGIRPVILVRNIFDSVISLFDFFNNGAYANSFFRGDYLLLDEDTRLDLLIDNLVPWYFQFVASWTLAEKRQQLEMMWLNYEDMIGDKPAAVGKVLDFYGLAAPMRGIEERISENESNKQRTRFNKGVAGRGRLRLSEAQRERICGYARFFPTTDFSRLGV